MAAQLGSHAYINGKATGLGADVGRKRSFLARHDVRRGQFRCGYEFWVAVLDGILVAGRWAQSILIFVSTNVVLLQKLLRPTAGNFEVQCHLVGVNGNGG